MTDKVTVELPSPFTGVLETQLVAEGDVVAVHAPIARFADEATGEQEAGATETPSPKAELAQDLPAELENTDDIDDNTDDDTDDGDARSLFRASKDDSAEPVYQVTRQDTQKGEPERNTGPYGRPVAVPAARKLARELGLELRTISGSGPNGRIRVDDVRNAAEEPKASAPVAPKAPVYKTPAGFEGLEERVPVRGLRRAIANQMVASHLQTVRTLHVDEVDATELVALRARLKPLAENAVSGCRTCRLS